MKNVSRAALATWVGLGLAGVGIVSPILWEQYKDTSALEVRQLTSSVIVSSVDGLEELAVTYRNEPVPLVSKIDLFVTNTGRRPIRGEDVVSPLSISVPNEHRILDMRVPRRVPGDLEITGAVHGGGRQASFMFPLLNPGDGAEVTLLLAGRSPALSVSGRIAGVRDVRLVDRRADASSVWRRLHAGVWIVIAFAGIGIAMLLALVWHLGAETQIAVLWSTGLLTFDATTSREFLERLAPYAKAKSAALAEIIKQLKKLPPDRPLTPESRTSTLNAIRRSMTKVDLYGPIALIGIPTLFGIWYVLSKIAG